MVKKILFILIFVLLLLLILNNNSFANSLDDLPNELKTSLSSTGIQRFEDSSQYIIFKTSSVYSLVFGNDLIYTTDQSSGHVYSSSYPFYSVVNIPIGSTGDGSKNGTVKNAEYSRSDFYHPYIFSANFTIIDPNVYYVYYEPPSTVYYTVSYNLNGGSGTSYSETIEDGDSLNSLWDGTGIIPPNNKYFVGWATSDSAFSPNVSAPFTPISDITLYAVYQDLIIYTITYNLNGGSGTTHTDNVQQGNSITLWSGSSFSPPEDKVFVGWATTSYATTYDVTSPYTPTGDITLYAVYEYNTGGFLQGIRNIISSITNISNMLNPNSVDTSSSQASINNTATDVKNKFNFADTIKTNVNDMVNVITNTESAPTFKINVSSERYTGEVTVLDLNWYAPYREYGNTVICIFAYLSFLWHMFLKIPSIIHGGEATTFSNKNNFDIVRR